MKRWVLVAALGGVLSACGSDSDDFVISVERSSDAALTSLAGMNITGAPLVSGTKSIMRTVSDGGVIEYAIPASDGYDNGTVRFSVTDSDSTPTQVAVMVDIPAVKGRVDGKQKYVAEDRVERAIKRDLKSWATRMEDSNSFGRPTASLETSMMSLAVVLQHMDDLEAVEKRLAAGGSAFFDSSVGENDGLSDDWDSESDPDQAAFDPDPMSDPDDDASSFGKPMDEAEGADTDPDGW